MAGGLDRRCRRGGHDRLVATERFAESPFPTLIRARSMPFGRARPRTCGSWGRPASPPTTTECVVEDRDGDEVHDVCRHGPFRQYGPGSEQRAFVLRARSHAGRRRRPCRRWRLLGNGHSHRPLPERRRPLRSARSSFRGTTLGGDDIWRYTNADGEGAKWWPVSPSRAPGTAHPAAARRSEPCGPRVAPRNGSRATTARSTAARPAQRTATRAGLAPGARRNRFEILARSEGTPGDSPRMTSGPSAHRASFVMGRRRSVVHRFLRP